MNKKNIPILEIISAIVATVSLIIMVIPRNVGIGNDELNFKLIVLSVALLVVLVGVYAVFVFKRIAPSKYIYISYAYADKDIAERIISMLEKQFNELTKYRFEFLTADSVPLGSDMHLGMKNNISKAVIGIIIVSPSYLESSWCLDEFTAMQKDNMKIIPIVTRSFGDLSLLPVDMSYIMALRIPEDINDKEFQRQVAVLAKDLIRQRKN